MIFTSNNHNQMIDLQPIFLAAQPISIQNTDPTFAITLNLKDRWCECQVYLVPQAKVLYKIDKNVYTVNPQSKMQPKFDCSSTIQSITISNNDKQITLHCKSTSDLQLLYNKLKRQISHKGFNEYFKPLKRLGKGSFAAVYLVQHKYSGEKMAAKVFSRQGQKISYMGYESLQNEIHMLKTLNNPNIIKFQGIYETDNLIYLVTEYLSGGTLVDFMRNKSKLMGDFITKIISDSLKALNYLQENSIMHRDLKPENIVMRESDGEWVLVDFGLAAYTNGKYLYDKCGTMGYIAPEILAENEVETPYNSSCDLYSLGVVAYVLILGCLPFKVEMQSMFESKFIWNAFKKSECMGLDKEILTLLKGLLEKQPSKRITPAQALSSGFFTDPQIIQNWREFNKTKQEQSYNKVLKSKNSSQ